MSSRIVLALVLALAFAPAAPRASSQDPIPPVFGPDRPREPTREERERDKKVNESRHKDLQKDTDKLLQLATELKQYVDSNPHASPADVSRKADHIAKLAKSIREKMRGY